MRGKTQKFYRYDLVLLEDVGEVVIMGSYYDQCMSFKPIEDGKKYEILHPSGNKTAWHGEDEMELLETNRVDLAESWYR